jgi:hypothetical protein
MKVKTAHRKMKMAAPFLPSSLQGRRKQHPGGMLSRCIPAVTAAYWKKQGEAISTEAPPLPLRGEQSSLPILTQQSWIKSAELASDIL